jgi:hypothetical protein
MLKARGGPARNRNANKTYEDAPEMQHTNGAASVPVGSKQSNL